MSWKPLVAASIKAAVSKTGLRCGLRKNRPTSRARMGLTVTPELAGRLDWSVDSVLQAEFGEGEHSGFVRFRKNASVGLYRVTRQGLRNGAGFFLRVDIGIVIDLPDVNAEMVDVDWARDSDGWVSFALPRWPGVPSALPTPAAVVPAGPSSRTASTRRGGNTELVARLMGDPAPGRSALDQRSGK